MATSLRGREKLIPPGRISPGRHYEAAARVLRAAKAHRDPDALFRALARELRSVFKLHTIGVVLYDEAVEAPQWCALDINGSSPSFSPLFRWEDSPCHWVYVSQQSLILEGGRDGDQFAQYFNYLAQFGVESACILPLTTGQRRMGAVIFAGTDQDFYSQEVVEFLTPVANQIALAMGDAVHFAALQTTRARLDNETSKLKLLLELNNAIVSDLDLPTLVKQISPRMRRLMQLDAVALILPDPKSAGFHLHALDFPQNSQESRIPQLLPRDSIAGEVFHSGKPWIGSLAPARRSSSQGLAAISGLQTLCALPLIRRQCVLGVLGLGRLREMAFAQSDLDFLLQVAQQVAIAVDNALEYRQAINLNEQLMREKLYLEHEIQDRMQFEEIVGTSSSLRQVLHQVARVAPTESTVLIHGETGTGKELIARAIHNLSARKNGPFVKVNCAALPAGLLESELFGHERGAFTGASAQRIGRFEIANQGTIFLDEISELPLELQPKLLRVLQEREFERLGSSRTLRTNARLIAATNRNVKSMVSEKTFRADLFYRLNVFPIELPALRDRPEDIPALAAHFVQHFAKGLNKHIHSISADTLHALQRYPWPGNIRELQNIIERAVILAHGPVLNIPRSELVPNMFSQHSESLSGTLEEVERRHILSVLKETHWVFSGPRGAAARLGIKRSTLQFRMKKLGISRPD